VTSGAVPERLSAALADSYRIEGRIGEGGMATVYLAADLKHERQVAIKVLKPELAASVGSERFLREIRTTANLRHPHIVPLYDSGDADGFLYYVMPFVEGQSLEQRLAGEPQLPLPEAVRIARQVAGALGYAHARGVVHRDIKPGNIMLEAGHAVVTDFGVAGAVSAAGGTKLTQTGMIVGTPAYMSPEQASGQGGLDARSDLYSLACVVYEMLAGQPPFTGATAPVLLARHALDPVPPVTTARPSVPAHLAGAIEQALSKTPADRFDTAERWVEALTNPPEDATQGAPAAATRSSATSATDAGERARPDLAIAVLPLVVPPGDPELEDLAEGLAEDLTTGLARFPHLTVVGGANSLGVRYLLRGRIRKSGSAIRVNMQLLDAKTRGHLWAETYDRSLEGASLFDVQDDLTDRIVSTVADTQGVLIRTMAESVRDKPLGEMTALDALFLAFDYWNLITPDAHIRARDALERIVQIEPNSAEAWSALSMIYAEEHKHSYNVRPDPLGRSLDAARRSIAADPTSQRGYYALAEAQFFRRERSSSAAI
jgi:serine/threonine-protein kinase